MATDEDLPKPLTPPECDLRDFKYMPLDVVRLRDADIASIESAEAFRAAVLSWCVAWHQRPAASLPDDDATLCRLLGYGRDIEAWRTVREAGALRGYVKCSDYRLYHTVVSEKACESWALKTARRDRTESARVAKLAQKAGLSVTEYTRRLSQTVSQTLSQRVRKSVTEHATESVTTSVTGSKERTGLDRTGLEDKKETSLREEKKTTPRGTRLPDDWNPGNDGAKFARDLGLDPKAVFAVFRDYWQAKPGKDGLKLDWMKTWRNWCRSDAERRGVKPNGNGDLLSSPMTGGF